MLSLYMYFFYYITQVTLYEAKKYVLAKTKYRDISPDPKRMHQYLPNTLFLTCNGD